MMQDDNDRIRANVARMRAKGASNDEVDHYLSKVEGLRTIAEPTMAATETTQARVRPATDPRSIPKRIQDTVSGAAGSVAHGLTLGFGDELQAAGSALASGHPIKNFEAKRREIDAPRERFAREHPVMNFAGEVAGGAGLFAALPMSRLVKPAASIVRKVGTGIATGAGIGGVAGAGAASGGVSERASGAGRGALAGAAIGGLLPAASGAGGLVLDATGARNTAPIRALARVSPVMDARARARQMIVQAMERDNLTLPEAMAKVNARHPNTIMDLAGDNTMGLGSGAASIPGRAKREIPARLHEREADAAERMKGEIGGALGVPREDAGAKAAELAGRRSGNARPAYEAAYMGAEVADPAVLEAFQIPAFARAYARGRRIAKLEGNEIPELTDAPSLPIRAIDYAKRGLDDLIDSGMRSGKMGRAEARALRQKLNDVLASVDASNPEYAAARKQFAGDSRLIEAHESGTALSKTDPDEVARLMTRAGPDEQQMFRSGAHDDLVNAMEKRADGRDVTVPLAGDAMKRRRTDAILPTGEAREAIRVAVEREKRMHQTRNYVTGNSATARRLREQTDIDDASLDDIAALARSPLQAGWSMMQAAAKRGRGLTEGVTNELSPMLTAGARGPGGVLQPGEMTLEDMLRQLLAFQGQQAQGSRRAGVFRRGVAGRGAGDWAGADERRR